MGLRKLKEYWAASKYDNPHTSKVSMMRAHGGMIGDFTVMRICRLEILMQELERSRKVKKAFDEYMKASQEISNEGC